MAVSKISSFWEYAISRQGTKLPESSLSSTLCLLKEAMLMKSPSANPLHLVTELELPRLLLFLS